MTQQHSTRSSLSSGRLHRFVIPGVLLVSACLGIWAFLQTTRRLLQIHNDPHVATVWVAGITYGPNLTLNRGSALLKWLNSHGIRAFGQAETLTSRFGSDPGGVEIWFAYRSHLPGHKLLECHRVGNTAFVDDLGQAYHGFLDFEGDYVGVYLPGYDHAARHLICTLHWMPRAPAAPQPVSGPMRFQIDLPPAHRTLPPADALSFGPVSQTQHGITATVSAVRLSAPTYGNYGVRQRNMIFRLDIRGGTLAASNADTYLSEMTSGSSSEEDPTANRLFAPWNGPPRPQNPFVITDPYGVSLIPQHDEITPMRALDTARSTHIGQGFVWIAPIDGAGRGTDAVRMRFDVQPTVVKAARPTPVPSTVSFDLTIRVRADDEV